MQYFSGIAPTMLRWFLINDLTPEEFGKIREYRKTLTIQNFPERLDEQFTNFGNMALIIIHSLKNTKI